MSFLQKAAFLAAILFVFKATCPSFASDPWRKVMVRRGFEETCTRLEEIGANLVSTERSVHFYELPESRLGDAESLPGLTVRTDLDLIRLEAGTIDTKLLEIRELKTHLQIIQFQTYPQNEDRSIIKSSGGRILGYLPENAYLVWMDKPENGSPLKSADRVQYIGELPKGLIVEKGFRERSDRSVVPISVTLFKDGEVCYQDLEAIYGNPHVVNTSLSNTITENVISVSLEVEAASVMEIARLESVVAIEPGARPRLFSENGAMVTANKTFLYDHDSDPETPPVEHALFDANATGAHENIYLRFLRDSLLYQPGEEEYKDPEQYPIVTVVDDGISNGGRADRIEQPERFPIVPGGPEPNEIPYYEDFNVLGQPGENTRIMFNFWYRWELSNYFGDNAWIIGEPDTYPSSGREIITGPIYIGGARGYEGDEIGPTGHGHGVASALAAYNGEAGPNNRHQPTQLGYGMGVSPYGRLGNAKFWSVASGAWMEDTNGFYDELDFYWITNTAWDAIDAIEEGKQGLAILNCSLGNERADACNDPDFDPTDPAINPTSPNYDPLNSMVDPTSGRYDRFSKMFDLLTRNASHPAIHPDQGPRPTLFLVGAGQYGFEYYGNGWKAYLDGEQPLRSLWQVLWQCGNPIANYVYGFHLPRTNTVASPGIAKNVLTVGASQSYDIRPVEVCDEDVPLPPEGQALYYDYANDPNDIGTYSAKGLYPLVGEARVKPDLVAPSIGDYVNMPADVVFPELRACYPGNVNNVVGAVDGTRIYQRSGGTSGATPLVTGVAQLSLFHLKHVYGIDDPSPALLKAYLIHTGKMLRGIHSGRLEPNYPSPPPGYEPPLPPETPNYLTHPFPSPYQGWGRVNSSMALEQTPRVFIDQTIRLSESESFQTSGVIADSGKPYRVSLVWTDPPNYLVAKDAYYDLENNLDLIVKLTLPDGGKAVYLGNRFSPELLEFSQEFPEDPANWPLPDRVNNVECVFLPPQPAGTRVEITVRADGLNMNGLDPFDQLPEMLIQDFALVVYNQVHEIQNDSPRNSVWFVDGVTRSWKSSPELIQAPSSVQEWLRPADFDAPGIAKVTLVSNAPSFTPGNFIEWKNPAACGIEYDPDRQQDVIVCEGGNTSGSLVSESELGWNKPAWDLQGKGVFGIWLKADNPNASIAVVVEATDQTRHRLVYKAGGHGFENTWKYLVRDLSRDLVLPAPEKKFSHVTGIEIDSAEGQIKLCNLKLNHFIAMELYKGSNPEKLERIGTSSLPFDESGELELKGYVSNNEEPLYISVAGSASRGSYTIVLEKEDSSGETSAIY